MHGLWTDIGMTLGANKLNLDHVRPASFASRSSIFEAPAEDGYAILARRAFSANCALLTRAKGSTRASCLALPHQYHRRQWQQTPLKTGLIISPAISTASDTAIMAMMNTAIVMGMAVMTVIYAAIIIGRANSTIIIGTAIMAASNTAIMATIIVRLLDDAARSDVERMDHAGKRRSTHGRDRSPTSNCRGEADCQKREQFSHVTFPSWLQSVPRHERFATPYFFTQAFVASSHFMSFAFSHSAFVFGASAANAGTVTATKRAAAIAELTILNDIFSSLGFCAFVGHARFPYSELGVAQGGGRPRSGPGGRG